MPYVPGDNLVPLLQAALVNPDATTVKKFCETLIAYLNSNNTVTTSGGSGTFTVN